MRNCEIAHLSSFEKFTILLDLNSKCSHCAFSFSTSLFETIKADIKEIENSTIKIYSGKWYTCGFICNRYFCFILLDFNLSNMKSESRTFQHLRDAVVRNPEA